ncbi:MAG: hypothetical protein K0Q52_144 [Microbacterium sp.]|nr:hypothetical protein [Microbacterium sp.]
MTYSAAAPFYLERGFQPIPVRDKRPVPFGATGADGTVTPEKVADWIQNGFLWKDPETKEWRNQDPQTANIALRAGLLEARIDVDDYGTKEGAAQLAALEAKLGPLPGTPSSTSRGQDSASRQYFFVLPEHVEMVGKAAKDIEVIQHSHRYSLVAPSRNPDAEGHPEYVWYDAEGELMAEPPRLEDLEYLPEAWIDYLRKEEGNHEHKTEQWDGDIPEVASETEERKLRSIVSSLQALPAKWAPGAGWHDTVFAAACWLARMARSNAYALTNDRAVQLLLDHTPTYPSWGADKIIEQWESADRTTAGQFEEPPLETRPPLLPWNGFPLDRAFPTIGSEMFITVWGSRPEKEGDGALWGRRRQLLAALLRSGFTDQEAATVVWHSAAARATGISFGGETFVDEDSKCITENALWRELDQAREDLAKADGSTVEAAPVGERPNYDEPTRISFLTDAERERVASPACEWWGSRFIDWANLTFDTVNLPYYRMNRWTVLSVILSPQAVLPRPGSNDRPLNLYQGIVGTTGSGKTEALRVVKHIFKAYYLLSETPDIGGNHTPESLVETLIGKDGQATWFHMDEAHTKIQVWKKIQGPYSEMPGVVTDVYDGDVGAVYRATKKEISGKSARAFMTAHFMGTPRGMTDVMSPDDWESGFLNRFVWAIGALPTEDDGDDDYLHDGEIDEETPEVASGALMYQQWASEFGSAIQAISRADGKPNRMKIPRDVIARHGEFKRALTKIALQHPTYTDRLKPTFRRLRETVMRCAALVALSDGRLQMSMDDMLIALEQAEEWATNTLTMVELTDESLRTREVNAIEQAVIAHGGHMPLAAIHRLARFKNRRRDVIDLIEELVAQGRVERKAESGVETVRLKGVLTNG